MKYSSHIKTLRADIRQLENTRAQHQLNPASIRYLTNQIAALKKQISDLRLSHGMKAKTP